jgi:hypothetical protein
MEHILFRKFGTDHLADLGIDGRIILKWTLEEIGVRIVDWLHLAWGYCPMAGSWKLKLV